MNIFDVHRAVIDDYRDFVRSFFYVSDDRARQFVDQVLDRERQFVVPFEASCWNWPGATRCRG